VEAKLRFQISRPGKHSLTVHALCDSYVGLDQKVDLNFTAKTEDEVKREREKTQAKRNAEKRNKSEV